MRSTDEGRVGCAGLHCVPITTPAGSEQFAAEEYNGTDDQARCDEREPHDGQGIGQTEGLRREVTEELGDFVLHVCPSAMSVPAGKIIPGSERVRFGGKACF